MKKKKTTGYHYSVSVTLTYLCSICAIISGLLYGVIHIERHKYNNGIPTKQPVYFKNIDLFIKKNYKSLNTTFLGLNVFNTEKIVNTFSTWNQNCQPLDSTECAYPIGHIDNNSNKNTLRLHSLTPPNNIDNLFDSNANKIYNTNSMFYTRFVIEHVLQSTNPIFNQLNIEAVAPHSNIEIIMDNNLYCDNLIFYYNVLPYTFANSTIYRYKLLINNHNSGCCISKSHSPNALLCYIHTWTLYSTSSRPEYKGLFILSAGYRNTTHQIITFHEYDNHTNYIMLNTTHGYYMLKKYSYARLLYPIVHNSLRDLYNLIIFNNPYNIYYFNYGLFPINTHVFLKRIRYNLDMSNGLLQNSVRQPCIPCLFYTYLEMYNNIFVPIPHNNININNSHACNNTDDTDYYAELSRITKTWKDIDLEDLEGLNLDRVVRYNNTTGLIRYDVGLNPSVYDLYYYIRNTNILLREGINASTRHNVCGSSYFGVNCNYLICKYVCNNIIAQNGGCNLNDDYIYCR